MTIDELAQFVRDDWSTHDNLPSREEAILYLIEEFGEVAEAIRKKDGRKQRSGSDDNIESEMADLLICYMTLAVVLDIDVTRGIKSFQSKMAARHLESAN